MTTNSSWREIHSSRCNTRPNKVSRSHSRSVRPRCRHRVHAACACSDATRVDVAIWLLRQFALRRTSRRASFLQQPGSCACQCWYWIRKTAGALFCRRFRGRRRCVGESAPAAVVDAVESLRSRNMTSTQPLSHAASAIPRRRMRASGMSKRSLRITGKSRSGPSTALRVLKTAPRWLAPRLHGSTAEMSTPMRLYEQAIRSAQANGFVHNEALAYELAARFYAARGFEGLPMCICGTRATAMSVGEPTARFGNSIRCIHTSGRKETSVCTDEHDRGAGRTPRPLDRDQGLAGRLPSEIVLGNTGSTQCMRTAIEQAGAERGLLILFRAGAEPRIEAEADADRRHSRRRVARPAE